MENLLGIDPASLTDEQRKQLIEYTTSIILQAEERIATLQDGVDARKAYLEKLVRQGEVIAIEKLNAKIAWKTSKRFNAGVAETIIKQRAEEDPTLLDTLASADVYKKVVDSTTFKTFFGKDVYESAQVSGTSKLAIETLTK